MNELGLKLGDFVGLAVGETVESYIVLTRKTRREVVRFGPIHKVAKGGNIDPLSTYALVKIQEWGEISRRITKTLRINNVVLTVQQLNLCI